MINEFKLHSKSTEDYLKTIYGLGDEHDSVTTSAIAEELKISSPSVTDMIKRLYDSEYINYTPYYGVRLTKKGERVALKIIRRHRLLEVFLMKVMNFPWELVHDEAERLEHVISDEFEDRLDTLLGFPQYDPHGEPIPTKDGTVEKLDLLRLSDVSVGDRAIVVKVRDSKPMLQLMDRTGLKLNCKGTVLSKESFDGSLQLKCGKKVHFMSREVAQNIYVKKAE